MTTVTMAGMTATGAEREEVRQAANQGASMIDTGPGWVRISDITPEIGDQMDRAAWTGDARTATRTSTGARQSRRATCSSPFRRCRPDTDPAKGWVRVRDIPPPSEPAFILDNLIHEATTVMFGRPEAGKSYVALSMACSLVSGRPWSRLPGPRAAPGRAAQPGRRRSG